MSLQPRVRVWVEDCRFEDQTGRWRVSWIIHNDGSAPLALEAAWIPHARFRGDGRLPMAQHLEAGATTRIAFTVATEGQPGQIVENAFLILRVSYAGRAWRIFSRMRVPFDTAGAPVPTVELTTVQAMAAS